MTELRLEVRPSPKLMESMRSLGYSTEVAVADIVDNSLDAGARRVHVKGDVSDDPQWLWIFDDGSGMTLQEMVDALTLASVSSVDGRSENALGRFGLGLKTATFSQCRRLTLVSRKRGETYGICFDLDEMREASDWSVRRLSPAELENVPGFEQLDRFTSGTLVTWENLDRLLESRAAGATGMGDVLRSLKNHLGLTFHRWIEPERNSVGQVEMLLNGHRVSAIDPFLRHNRAVDFTAEETIRVDHDAIVVQAFTLPDSSKIGAEDAEREDLGEGMYKAQGFYFYRNRRLISHGGWANLGGRRDLTKHSRIRVDLPNSVDDAWQLDVMKNKVIPPAAVRRELFRFYTVGGRRSGRVIAYRGRRETSSEAEYAWTPVTERGGFRYEPNPNHPVLAEALDDLDATQRDRVVKAVQRLGLLIPYGDIRRRMSVDDETPAREQSEVLVDQGTEIARLMGLHEADAREVEHELGAIEPFAGRRDLGVIVAKIMEKL